MRFDPTHAVIVLISAMIAWLSPFDIAFAAVTFGSPVLRVILMAAVALSGVHLARSASLRLDGHTARSPALIGVMAAMVVAAYVVLIDAFLFRHLLAPEVVEFLRSPVAQRLLHFMLRAFNENVIYRSFVFSLLLCLVRTKSTLGTVVLMVVAQPINIGVNVVLPSGDASVGMLAYDALRYVVPGVLWAWLFWRFGFVVAEVASVGCHVFLQPAYGVLI
ncbi:hypothetical protein JQ615_07605 [Bradyrhizobium jicamae]|uniref:Uncharacterized protein n=1 Tax=Bradyrhizobium jicamae TaxID=280332 RepID=A0ABS5FEP3_9BRAD|nr:hypothetical protein [Bradyrhizobium jicamae]MBR0795248.1 hypothetical protein [Bradyrhizobium jicamae]MBR0931768.1 hypothetical protein [Bradyrhizobium jicamae]